MAVAAAALLLLGSVPPADAQAPTHTKVTVKEGANRADEVHNRPGGIEYTVNAKFTLSRDQGAYFKLVPAPDDLNAAYGNGTLSSDRKKALGGWSHHLFLLNETGGVLKYDATGKAVNGDLGFTVDTTPTPVIRLEGGRTYHFRSVVGVPDKAGLPEGQRVLIRYHLVAADSQSRGGSGGAQDPAAAVEALLILHGEGAAGPSRGISLDVQGLKDGVVTSPWANATGKVAGAETLELLHGGDLVRALKPDAQGRFDFSLELKKGLNGVQVVAKNRQGDKAQKTFSLYYQPTAAEKVLALPSWGGIAGAPAEAGMPWVFDVQLLSTDAFTSVNITLREYAEKPGFIGKDFNLTAGRYFSVTARGVGPDGGPTIPIQEAARFTVRVPKAWLEAEGIAPESVALQRWNGAAWEPVPATLARQDADYAYYAAEAPGLGEFAVAGKAGALGLPPPGGTTEPSPGDAGTGAGAAAQEQGQLLMMAAPVAAAAVAAAALVLRQRRRSAAQGKGTTTLDAEGMAGGPAPPAPSAVASLFGAAASPSGVAAAGASPAQFAGFELAMTQLTQRLADAHEGWQQDREALTVMADRIEALDHQLTSMERELGQRLARDRPRAPTPPFHGSPQAMAGTPAQLLAHQLNLQGGARFGPAPGAPQQPGALGSRAGAYLQDAAQGQGR